MDAFVDLPTWAEFSAGTGDIAAGFFTTFSPLIFWAFVIGLGAAIVIIFFGMIINTIKYADSHWQYNNPMDIANLRQNTEIQKKNANWIKPGSTEDLANKHYGRIGREKEIADRAIYKKRHSII